MSDTASPTRNPGRVRPMAQTEGGPPPPYILRSRPRKLLIVSNCQTFGLVNCVQSLSDFVAEGMIINAFIGQGEALPGLIAGYDHVFAIRAAADAVRDPEAAAKIVAIPHIYFNAFHPDMFRLDPVLANNRKLGGPAGHSIIAAAGFERGLSAAETASLFRGDVFRAVGYLDVWDEAKAGLFAHFHELGFAIDRYFYRWCREGCFMHANNHPAIACVMDIATEALGRIGCRVSARAAGVIDNLMTGPIFPVYDEIAAIYGVPGSYRFKPAQTSYTIGLDAFIKQSFALYREAGGGKLQLSKYDRAKVDRVLRLLD